jgi:hypothetical protein
MVTRVGIEEA